MESILARRKPDDAIDRTNAVYLSETNDPSLFGLTYDQGYIHTVAVKGKVQKRDTNLVGELQKRHHANPLIAKLADQRLAALSDDEVADKYYAGEPSQQPTWEYLAEGGTVEEVADEPVKIRSKSADLLAEVLSSGSGNGGEK